MNFPVPTSKDNPSSDHLRLLPTVGQARPKRRCKAQAGTAQPITATRLIVPMESQRPRPAKFKKSGRPFQIWKEPSAHSDAPAEPTKVIVPFLYELVRHCTRTTAGLSAAPLGHSH